ncbi:transcriptional regulator [Xanthomonas citri pv. malvacearum str. GSPB2388]|nr:transcriptional regulator [Xanthomonas citri pv. malvacearum str. GSPB2388]
MQQFAAATAVRTRQQGFDAHLQLGQREGFGQVVVGAGAETGDLVRQFVACGEHDHRQFGLVLLTQPAQHFRSIHARHHPVQDQRVVMLGGRQMQAGDAIGRSVQGMPARFEIVEQVGNHIAVVFNDQQPHERVSRTARQARCAHPNRGRPNATGIAGTAFQSVALQHPRTAMPALRCAITRLGSDKFPTHLPDSVCPHLLRACACRLPSLPPHPASARCWWRCC